MMHNGEDSRLLFFYTSIVHPRNVIGSGYKKLQE